MRARVVVRVRTLSIFARPAMNARVHDRGSAKPARGHQRHSVVLPFVGAAFVATLVALVLDLGWSAGGFIAVASWFAIWALRP